MWITHVVHKGGDPLSSDPDSTIDSKKETEKVMLHVVSKGINTYKPIPTTI